MHGVRWVIGDVHGCARELEDLLAEIRYDPARDEAWSIGDLVNTGPFPVETLRLWKATGGRGVLGNHDIYALLVRSGAVPRRRDRLDPLLRAKRCDDLLEDLRRLPVLAALPRDDRGRVWLVHAGIHPRWKDLDAVRLRLDSDLRDDRWLRSHDVGFATRVRCCSPTGDRVRYVGKPENCPPPHRPWDAFYSGRELVVHGHWAMRGYYRAGRTIGLDSGCVYGGHLTAWSVDEDRIVQVPCREAAGYSRGG